MDYTELQDTVTKLQQEIEELKIRLDRIENKPFTLSYPPTQQDIFVVKLIQSL